MTDIVERLRATPNWQRESFDHWKTATSVYDRAPFEAADEIERLRKDAARYRRLRENWIECNELSFAGRLAALDARVDAAMRD